MWFFWFAFVGIVSTDAGCVWLLFSFVNAAAAICTILMPLFRLGLGVRNAGRRDRSGFTSCSMRRSFTLPNIAITVAGGRNLARRAAWFLDNEPDERQELAPSAFVFMAEEASKAATMAVQVQGGLGVSAEAAATAYLVRARGWALAGGDPGAVACYIAEIVSARESGGVK